jgi:hypothetical protein
VEPLENIRSAVSFGWTDKATITVTLSPENFPVFPFKGGEQDHKNRLEACRHRAANVAQGLRNGKWNARQDYADAIDQYLACLPSGPEQGNFLLADSEARIIRAMFAADQDFLPTGFAAQLQILIEQHFGLRAYYPETPAFYDSVRSGDLKEQLPLDAVKNFAKVVRDHSPEIFEPSVPKTFGQLTEPVPPIETAHEEAPRADANQPVPPPDPIPGPDPVQEQRYNVASAANGLWKVVKNGPAAYAGVEAYEKLLHDLGPYAEPIINWLRIHMGV